MLVSCLRLVYVSFLEKNSKNEKAAAGICLSAAFHFLFGAYLLFFFHFISFSSPFSFFPFLKLEFQLPVLRFQGTVLLVFLPGFF